MTKSRTLQEIRKAELSQIHIGKKQLGWTEDEYRAVIHRISKGATDSAGELNHKQRAELVWYMKSCGFKIRKPARPTKTKQHPDIPVNQDRDQVKKIRWQWLDLFGFGEVRDSSERAMCAYIARIAKITDGKEHPKFLTLEQASAAIEALKQWQHRIRLTPFLEVLPNGSYSRRAVLNAIMQDTQTNILTCNKADWDTALAVWTQKMKGAPHG